MQVAPAVAVPAGEAEAPSAARTGRKARMSPVEASTLPTSQSVRLRMRESQVFMTLGEWVTKAGRIAYSPANPRSGGDR
jgi:hypothetical protein